MTAARLSLLCLLWLDAASPAALVRVPEAPTPALPLAAFEPNRGQSAPEVLFLKRGPDGVAVTAQGLIFATVGVRQQMVGANPDPAVRFLEPLPGVVNSLSGGDPAQWRVGLPRYGAALVENVYPGVHVYYELDAEGHFVQRLLLAPGVDPESIVFEVPTARDILVRPEGSLSVQLTYPSPALPTPGVGVSPPSAVQPTPAGELVVEATFQRLSSTRYRVRVDGRNGAFPLEIVLRPGSRSFDFFLRDPSFYVVEEDGFSFASVTVGDAPGKPAPFPESGWAGCGTDIYVPFACTDVAVYKVSASGDLVFVTYLEGRTTEEPVFLDFASDGSVIVVGNTDSSDFPTSLTAIQREFAGPPRVDWRNQRPNDIRGDFFAARLDPQTGELLAATYLGGSDTDQVGKAELGPDGSLYFLPEWLGRPSGDMPTSPTALLAECPDDPCRNGYAARLSPALDRLQFGTYLPGRSQATATLHSDGSLYFAGTAEAGLPTSPTAYRREPSGPSDGFVARLDPNGERLLFATYVGGPDSDSIFRMAVAQDGSVWAAVTSFEQCCVDIDYRLVRFDANGERILADLPIDVGDIQVGPDGNLRALAWGDFVISPDAFLAHPCESPGLAYLELSPTGASVFTSYLPTNIRSDFAETGDSGLPLLTDGVDRFEVVRQQDPGIFAGCLVDAASFSEASPTPGGIVTLFGSRLGPEPGVAFELEGGRVPTEVGGVRVLIDGEPAPILFASYWQINAILPYSLVRRSRLNIVVEQNGGVSEPLPIYIAERAVIELFRRNASSDHPAAALNQDGTVNTASNPAAPGSVVSLFGTGAGATVPPSEAGEVTPLELRVLEQAPRVRVVAPVEQELLVEFAGAAPGLVAGVTQINIRLPEQIPEVPGFAPGLLPLQVETPGYSYPSAFVTIAVAVD